VSRILVAGLNPAWQKILEIPALRPGEVNRARTVMHLASGKGMNAAKVLRALGHEVSLLQVLGGDNGKRCQAACAALGIKSLHAWVGAETRQCVTVLEANGLATELIEPFSFEASKVEEQLLAELPAAADAFDAIVVSGSIPAGVPNHVYDALLKRFTPRVAIWDAVLEISPASLEKVTCVKVNRKEYEAMQAHMGALGDRAPIFMVTDGGGEAAMLRGGREVRRFSIPRLEQARNPIGAGDTVTAGLTHFLLQGVEPAEAFRRGLAMGSASCLRLEPAEYDAAKYEYLLDLVRLVTHAPV
jgi:fructose-1-phosphate kinase PfkB-like protein